MTGMKRTDFAAMTGRVRQVLEAPGERHRRRRRGGEILPGARGGVFTQKITPDERVLATMLYQRKRCSQDTLAELLAVSRRTIGNLVREVGLLTQDGYTPAPTDKRVPDADSLVNAATHQTQFVTLPLCCEPDVHRPDIGVAGGQDHAAQRLRPARPLVTQGAQSEPLPGFTQSRSIDRQHRRARADP